MRGKDVTKAANQDDTFASSVTTTTIIADKIVFTK